MRQIKEDYHKLHTMPKQYGRLPHSQIAYKPVMNLTQVDPQSLHSMCGVGGVQRLSGGVPHASGNLSDLANPMSFQQQFAQSQKVSPHPDINSCKNEQELCYCSSLSLNVAEYLPSLQ